MGIPAITPRINLTSTTSAHFTEADVRNYMARHRIPYAVPGAAAPVTTAIQWMSAKQAGEQVVHESTGLPDATPLCVVFLSGSFLSTGGPSLGRPIPYQSGWMVFDALSGNLLISSVG